MSKVSRCSPSWVPTIADREPLVRPLQPATFTPQDNCANPTPSPYPMPCPAGTSSKISFGCRGDSTSPFTRARWKRLRSPLVEMTSPAAPSQVMFCSVASWISASGVSWWSREQPTGCGFGISGAGPGNDFRAVSGAG